MRARGYKVQNGCHNCEHAYRYWEYDGGDQYYCNFWGDRPPCTSIAMKEIRDIAICTDEWHRARDKWEKWADTHDVDPAGICEFYKKSEEKG